MAVLLHDVVVGSLNERSRHFEPTTDGHTVEPGQHEIEDDDIKPFREASLDGRKPIADRLDGVLRASQQIAHAVAEDRLVHDEENSQR